MANILIDRPPGNRFSAALLRELIAVLEDVAVRDDVRCVLLSAAGADFSHGADLADPEQGQRLAEPGGGHAVGLEMGRLGQRLVRCWRDCPVPTVIAVRGHVVGAGACLFAAADFRVGTADARLLFPEVDRGMYLGWGILPRLVQEFGPSLARRLALAGEAMALSDLPAGTVSTVQDDDLATQAATVAASLAAKPPLAVREIRAVLNRIAAGDDAVVARDPERLAATLDSADFMEAVSAWLEGREARYSGR